VKEAAIQQLQQDGASVVLEGVLESLEENPPFDTESEAQSLIKQVTKDKNVKKGLVMRTLRAALTGDLHGPDLVQSWLLLHQRGFDQPRLQQAIALTK
jgi:glutamyl-tRNA synthetase